MEGVRIRGMLDSRDEGGGGGGGVGMGVGGWEKLLTQAPG